MKRILASHLAGIWSGEDTGMDVQKMLVCYLTVISINKNGCRVLLRLEIEKLTYEPLAIVVIAKGKTHVRNIFPYWVTLLGEILVTVNQEDWTLHQYWTVSWLLHSKLKHVLDTKRPFLASGWSSKHLLPPRECFTKCHQYYYCCLSINLNGSTFLFSQVWCFLSCPRVLHSVALHRKNPASHWPYFTAGISRKQSHLRYLGQICFKCHQKSF